MKKMISCMLTLAVLASVLLSGCTSFPDPSVSAPSSSAAESSQKESSEEPEEPSSEEPQEESSEAESSEEESSKSTGSKLYDTVSEYVQSSIFQGQLASMKESMAESDMDIDIVGEGNALVYVYTYPAGTPTEGLAEALESVMQGQEQTFIDVATSIKAIVNEENPVVIVRYVESDGTVIYEQEFEAE